MKLDSNLDAPQPSSSNSEIYLLGKGLNSSLECNFDSNPPPMFVVWTHNGVLLPKAETARLALYNITDKDSGLYSCQAFNLVGSSRPFEMHVAVASQYIVNWQLNILCVSLLFQLIIRNLREEHFQKNINGVSLVFGHQNFLRPTKSVSIYPMNNLQLKYESNKITSTLNTLILQANLIFQKKRWRKLAFNITLKQHR